MLQNYCDHLFFFLMKIEDEIVAYLLLNFNVLFNLLFYSLFTYRIGAPSVPLSPHHTRSFIMNFQLYACRSKPYYLLLLDQ